MLLITTTHKPASDLGHLLHKNPSRAHRLEFPFGEALVVYPEATKDRCTGAVILDIDPVGLIRGNLHFDQYVNDRPYVASSFLASALSRLFGTTMSGRSKERQELAETEIPLEFRLPVVRVLHTDLVKEIFEPLGYEVESHRLPMDKEFPDWGESPYIDLKLRTRARLRDALVHLTVLIPVLDNQKHYYVNIDEVDKLMRRGAGWLETHPAKETIARRYLRNDRTLVRQALLRLAPEIESEDEPRPPSLHDQRHEQVVALVRQISPTSVLDLGCGDGKLVALLLKISGVKRVTGVDVSMNSLERAAKRLRLDQLSPRAKERVNLLHGSLVYRDSRLAGYDLACVVEVIEHLEPERLRAFERSVFEFARPTKVIVTTPNREYNALYEGMKEGQTRHSDHRFEWSRAEFQLWAERVGFDHGYRVEFQGIGDSDPKHGPPSQMGVFSR